MNRKEILEQLDAIYQRLRSTRQFTYNSPDTASNAASDVLHLLDQWPSKGETVSVLMIEVRDMLRIAKETAKRYYDHTNPDTQEELPGGPNVVDATNQVLNAIEFFVEEVQESDL